MSGQQQLQAVREHVKQKYDWARTTPSDIYEHIERFREMALDCNHITEMGIRSCLSSWGFLMGLLEDMDPPMRPKRRLIGVDINYHPNIGQMALLCAPIHPWLSYEFRLANDVETTIEPTDLLFIDTWHVYGHLKRELAAHHKNVRRWIVLHDTSVDAVYGESIRLGHDIADMVAASGYPVEEIKRGIWPAVEEFLAQHEGIWRLHQRLENCNGLTVLERVKTEAGGA